MQKGNNIIKSIQNFIRIPSYSGQEKEAAHFLKKLMQNLGYDDVYIDNWGNVIGIIEGKSTQTILLEGHLDTVEVDNEDDWKHAPFKAETVNNRIYGRGASDMKGALITMVYAGAAFANDKDLNKNIVVAGTVQEEIFEGVAQANIINEINPNLVIIGEASDLKLCIGQRGRAEIKVTTFGKNAHSSNPKKGINAVKKMNKFLTEIEKIPTKRDNDLGEGILEVVDIKSKPYPGHSVIPHQCSITLDRRLLPNETEKSVLKPLNNLIDKLKKEDTDFKAKVEIPKESAVTYTNKKFKADKFFPGWKFSVDNEFVKNTYDKLKNEIPETDLSYYSFCTNGSYSAGEQNIPTLGFGPSCEHLAHIADEYIEINQIEKAYQGYISIIETFLENNF